MRQAFIILTVTIFFTFIISIALIANAQTSNTDKRYTNCDTSIPELDNMRYTDGRQISYDIVDCPTRDIIIHDWNLISTIDKTAINNSLTARGYEEKEEVNRSS